ncbi:MAG TPA: phosphotransferase, partial [Chloroflexaceae bacterium]|nr:phosphotransferase [Chloroflexaceae bacterium]
MPTIAPEGAQALARELYGLDAAARPLPGEYDANFHLAAADGAEYVLKVMHAGAERSTVELQVALLAHLAAHESALALPRVRPSLAGAPIAAARVEGEERLVWLLTYLPGRLMAEARPHADELLSGLGTYLGRLDAALADFAHPAAARELRWDLARAGWAREDLGAIADPGRRALAARFLDRYEAEAAPRLPGLRRSVIHNDANDYNVLVSGPREWPQRALAVIDFGDALLTATVCEVAIAAAYALLGKPDPLAAAALVVGGYHRAHPLTDDELAALFPLIGARLAVSVVNSALRRAERPDDPYLTISEAPAWEALERLAAVHPRFAHATLRAACGLPPFPHGERVRAWLEANRPGFAPVLDLDLRRGPVAPLDLSIASLALGADPRAVERDRLGATIAALLAEAAAPVGAGGYGEARLLYTAPAFGDGAHPTDERRTIHLGLDLWLEAGAPVYAPLAGTVHTLADNAARLDYGPLVILAHRTGDGDPFFTLYGHLDRWALEHLSVGQAVAAGERVGSVGAPPENGDWPPHLHMQIMLDLLELGRDYPGVALASQRDVWLALSPDPNL